MKAIKRSFSVLVAALMLLSTLAIAPISTNAAINTVYLKAGEMNTGDEIWYAWTWSNSSDGTWVKSVKSSSYWQFSNIKSKILFVRMNPNASNIPRWNSGDNDNAVWNQTDDLDVENDLYVIDSWSGGKDGHMGGYWSGTSEDSGDDTTEYDDYVLCDDINNGMILQAWNWSYDNIKAKLDKIVKAGFTTIQISPPNELAGGTLNSPVYVEGDPSGWWAFYQPAGFRLNQSSDNALGTKSQLVSMVKAAHEKGVKVIADTVINHMGTCDYEDKITSNDPMDHVTLKAKTFEPEIYNNKLFHYPWEEMQYHESSEYSEWDVEYDLTRKCTSRLPDLATEDSRVQNAIYDYLKEMVDAGIDGFRIDAAKHIETPSDTYCGSDFWPNTVSKVKSYAKSTYGKSLLSYGEILNTCGYGRSYSEYYPYMKVTDSGASMTIASAVDGGDASGATMMNMYNGAKSDTILWDESHDTYMKDASEWGSTRNFSDTKLNKIWAATASRDGITAVYLARPESWTQKLGEASETAWTSRTVQEINNFNNVFEGQSEYLSNGSNVAVIGRGSGATGGAVLINCNSGTSRSISSVPIHTMSDGKYKDRISGNEFTVSNNTVSGRIGSSGVAVIYKSDDTPSVYASASAKYTGESFTVKLSAKKVDYATFEINGSTPEKYTNGQTITVGTSADKAGAAYRLTVKGYVGSTVKSTETYTYQKTSAETNYKITVKTNSVSGWSGTPYIYAWNDSENIGAWPGTKMSGSGGTYTYSLDAKYKNVIFNMGSGGKQTVDIPITESTTYTILSSTEANSDGTACNKVSSVSAKAEDTIYYPAYNPTETEATETTTVPEYKDCTVTLDTNGVAGWTGTPNVYAYNPAGGELKAWPGTAMTLKSGNVYTATVSSQYDMLVFNMGEDKAQTINLEFKGDMNYKILSETEKNEGGTTCNKAEIVKESESTSPPTTESSESSSSESSTSSQDTTAASEPSESSQNDSGGTESSETTKTSESSSSSETVSQYKLGDVNRDGNLDIRDVTHIQRYLVSSETFDKEQKYLADYNGDGKTTILDATLIQRALVNKEY